MEGADLVLELSAGTGSLAISAEFEWQICALPGIALIRGPEDCTILTSPRICISASGQVYAIRLYRIAGQTGNTVRFQSSQLIQDSIADTRARNRPA